jgi:hypothetical protein
MRRCTYCGKEYDDAASVCVIDGQPLAAVPPTPEGSAKHSRPAVEFIRLFFKSRAQEEFAVRCAQSIARIVGERITLLRPDTTWSEILEWFGPGVRNAALFAAVLRQEFGSDFNEVLRNREFMTFREFVEYVCSREHRRA